LKRNSFRAFSFLFLPPEENMILQMILGGESYVQNQVQTGRRN
jgi:hypothetical protein